LKPFLQFSLFFLFPTDETSLNRTDGKMKKGKREGGRREEGKEKKADGGRESFFSRFRTPLFFLFYGRKLTRHSGERTQEEEEKERVKRKEVEKKYRTSTLRSLTPVFKPFTAGAREEKKEKGERGEGGKEQRHQCPPFFLQSDAVPKEGGGEGKGRGEMGKRRGGGRKIGRRV